MYLKIQELTKNKIPFVLIILVDVKGSAPQDQGSKMLVTEDGLFFGTIGGGKIEHRVIETAQEMLSNKDIQNNKKFIQWNLKKDIGMTCGGAVSLYFEAYNVNLWNIVIFGAGHVASALINVMRTLDCQITCVDSRQEWLDKLPEYNNLTKKRLSYMTDYVNEIPVGSYILLITMGHTYDRSILIEILKDHDFPFIGVIGSRAKRIELEKGLIEAGIKKEKLNSFHCPLGLKLGSNKPSEIAISMAAQLLQERDNN